MEPFFEAKGQHPRYLENKKVPPLVLQISDGENGGVMMNEFPANYKKIRRGEDILRREGL